MKKTILYLFRIDNDFNLGYSWSAELTRRLKASLSLFTTFQGSPEAVGPVYSALAEAESFYIKNFHLLSAGLPPIKSERHFIEGGFENSLLDFLDHHRPDIIVLKSDLLNNGSLKQLIDSETKLIVLSSIQNKKVLPSGKNREQLFIDILQHATLYNIPVSFFKTISQDTGLFNYISSLFKK